MKTWISGFIGLASILVLGAFVSIDDRRSEIRSGGFESRDRSRPWQLDDGRVEFQGRLFGSWEEWRRVNGFDRAFCSAPGRSVGGGGGIANFGPSDCPLDQNNPSSEYDPAGGDFVVPVVVHVILNDTGSMGNIGHSQIVRQIEILNDDFAGIGLGSEGSAERSGIRFVLAGLDPDGVPTNGVTRSQNSSWFNDQGDYWKTLAWDPNRFLNIYTNTTGGSSHGYVSNFPAAGFAGDLDDRIVIDFTAFGEDTPIGPPYEIGRILTHEVGHYFGLFHTFEGGCETSSCHVSGDLICDTPSHYLPTDGCQGSAECGFDPPVSNFMNYSDSACMSTFSPDQVRRMRCTAVTYRPSVIRHSESCFHQCEADFNRDGTVDGTDLGILLTMIGEAEGDRVLCGDFNLDGIVDGMDFGRVLAAWGDCPEDLCEDTACDSNDECEITYCVLGECRSLELSICGVCGIEGSGSCYEIHSNPSCDDYECCQAICIYDEFCCFGEWDVFCRNLAVSGDFPTCDGG